MYKFRTASEAIVELECTKNEQKIKLVKRKIRELKLYSLLTLFSTPLNLLFVILIFVAAVFVSIEMEVLLKPEVYDTDIRIAAYHLYEFLHLRELIPIAVMVSLSFLVAKGSKDFNKIYDEYPYGILTRAELNNVIYNFEVLLSIYRSSYRYLILHEQRKNFRHYYDDAPRPCLLLRKDCEKLFNYVTEFRKDYEDFLLLSEFHIFKTVSDLNIYSKHVCDFKERIDNSIKKLKNSFNELIFVTNSTHIIINSFIDSLESMLQELSLLEEIIVECSFNSSKIKFLDKIKYKEPFSQLHIAHLNQLFSVTKALNFWDIFIENSDIEGIDNESFKIDSQNFNRSNLYSLDSLISELCNKEYYFESDTFYDRYEENPVRWKSRLLALLNLMGRIEEAKEMSSTYSPELKDLGFDEKSLETLNKLSNYLLDLNLEWYDTFAKHIGALLDLDVLSFLLERKELIYDQTTAEYYFMLNNLLEILIKYNYINDDKNSSPTFDWLEEYRQLYLI